MTLVEFTRVLNALNLEGAIANPRRTEIIWRGMSILFEENNKNSKASITGGTSEFLYFTENLQKKMKVSDRYEGIEINDIAIDYKFKKETEKDFDAIKNLEKWIKGDSDKIRLFNGLLEKYKVKLKEGTIQELEEVKKEIQKATDVRRNMWNGSYEYIETLEAEIDYLVNNIAFNRSTIDSRKFNINVARRKAHKNFERQNLPIYEIKCATREAFLLLMIEYMNYIGKQNNIPEIDEETYYNMLMSIDARILNDYNENKKPLKNMPEYVGLRARVSKRKIGKEVIGVLDEFENSVSELITESLKKDSNNNYVGAVALSVDAQRNATGYKNCISIKSNNFMARICGTDDNFDFVLSYINDDGKVINVIHSFGAGDDCVEVLNINTGKNIEYHTEENSLAKNNGIRKKAKTEDLQALLNSVGSATQFMQYTIKEYKQKQATK